MSQCILVWSPNYAPELTGIPPLVTDACRWLAARGFPVVTAERYGMYYRHEPGRAVRVLSHQPLLGLAQVSFRLANVLAGPLGNKLAVVAERTEAPAAGGVRAR